MSPDREHARRRHGGRAALAEAEELIGHPLIDDCQVDEATGELLPVLTIVTDNGGPFRSFTFEAFIATHPEIRHVRTRVRTRQVRTDHANAGSGR